MTMSSEAIPPHTKQSSASTKPSFQPPGPGVWLLDAAHCERPRSRYMNVLFEKLFPEGFRRGFERYGSLLETIEYKPVESYPYLSFRPLGAPPDAKGTPPKWLFKLLVMLHPALRKRCKRAAEVMEQRVWREDIARFWRELPAEEAKMRELGAVELGALSDAELVAHVERVNALAEHRILQHFEEAAVTMLPVGDFVAHVRAWTKASVREALAPLAGSSPASVGGTRAMGDAADAIRSDTAARLVLEEEKPAAEVLTVLRSRPGAVGDSVSKLLDRYGDVVVAGHDLSEPTLREMPDLVVATLRARVAADGGRSLESIDAERAASELRSRTPEAQRPEFDDLLREARAAYPLRDARAAVDFWAIGVLRRTLLEVGRRLEASGRITRQDDVFDFSSSELLLALRGEGGPSSAELGARAHWRRTGKVDDAPAFLGGTPGEPPPAEWLPRGAARAARGFATYIEAIDHVARPGDKNGPVRGVGASAGRRTGRARLVKSAADFAKLRQGDILVAPITTPAYNVILPLLGGVVTDRGGLLSHPAIVSREYGFPGVVGARDATVRIPDGALIEIDGDAGTVKVLT